MPFCAVVSHIREIKRAASPDGFIGGDNSSDDDRFGFSDHANDGHNGDDGDDSYTNATDRNSHEVDASERGGIVEKGSVHSDGSDQRRDLPLYSSDDADNKARGFAAAGYETDSAGTSFRSNSVGDDSVGLDGADGNGTMSLSGGSSEWTPLLGPNFLGSPSRGQRGEFSEEQVTEISCRGGGGWEGGGRGGGGEWNGGGYSLFSPWRLNTSTPR